ncbi:hypothetical protein LSTR_LSTR005842 [Laodelphax striatellus]|uniref:Uncharacterized protein n=1 Tax=Laodelphax striatellus TaxID=195883 RepID=A0A482WRX5_LAOST|nr:hypothetical protein LSTR_LSTR005842 [Laodelphax striatellus]
MSDSNQSRVPTLPLYYPAFNAAPEDLFERRSTSFAEESPSLGLNDTTAVDTIFRSEFQQGEKGADRSKKLWDSHQDYLWMLVISNIDFLNGLSLAESSLRYGAWTMIIFTICSCSFTLIFSYLVIFLSVYSKKSVICYGDMVPLFSGFGYLIIIAASVKYAIFLGLMTKLVLALIAYLRYDFKNCTSPTYRGAECIDSTITSIQQSILSKNDDCHSVRGTLFVQCGSDEKLYILSSSTIIDALYTDLNIQYGAIILTIFILILIIRFIELEMPNFIKLAKLSTVIVMFYQLFLVMTSVTLQGEFHFHDVVRLNTFSLSGVFEAICLSLPKLSDMFVTTSSCTGRLPLCTQPAIDSALVVMVRILVMWTSTVVFGMMVETVHENYHIGTNVLSHDYLPFSVIPLYMDLMPFATNIWLTLFFSVCILLCFIKQLSLLEAIHANVVWYYGYNKIILATLYFFIGALCVGTQAYTPNENDIKLFHIQAISINIPMLMLFGISLIIYGSDRIEEDITFMTSSPPAELIKRLLRLLPIISFMLMIWSGWHLTSIFQVFIILCVIGSVVVEVMVRVVFLSYDSDAQVYPRPGYGPPNSTLKEDRKNYVLESKRISSMYAIKANILFRKLKAKEKRHSVKGEKKYVSNI